MWVRVQALWQASYSFSVSYGNSAHVSCDGQDTGEVGVGSIQVGGNGGTLTMLSHDFYIKKTDNSRSIMVDAFVRMNGGYANGFSGNHAFFTLGGINYKTPNPPTNVHINRNDDSASTLTWSLNYDNNALKPWKSIRVGSRAGSDGNDYGAWNSRPGYPEQTLTWSATSYKFNGFRANQKSQFSIYAVNQAGASTHVNTREVYTTPYAPASVSATKLSYNSVKVSVDLSNTYCSQWQLQRRLNGGDWSSVSSNISGSSYTDSSAPAGKVQYQVRCFRNTYSDAGPALYSPWSSTEEIQAILPPNPPASFKAVKNDEDSITISWSSSSSVSAPWDNVSLYSKESIGKSSFSDWKLIYSASASNTSFTDSSHDPNARYQYKLNVSNDAGTSSDTVSSIISNFPAKPIAVTASIDASKNATVSANISSSNASLINIDRTIDGDNWSRVASNISGSWVDTSHLIGSIRYRAAAVRPVVDDSLSSVMTSDYTISNIAVTSTPPAAPTVAISNSTVNFGDIVTISWTPNITDGTNNEVSKIEVTDGSKVYALQFNEDYASVSSFMYAFHSVGDNYIRIQTKSLNDNFSPWSSQVKVTVKANSEDLINLIPSPKPKTIQFLKSHANSSVSVSNSVVVMPTNKTKSFGFSYGGSLSATNFDAISRIMPVNANDSIRLLCSIMSTSPCTGTVSIQAGNDSNANTIKTDSISLNTNCKLVDLSGNVSNDGWVKIDFDFLQNDSSASCMVYVKELFLSSSSRVSEALDSSIAGFDGDEVYAELVQSNPYQFNEIGYVRAKINDDGRMQFEITGYDGYDFSTVSDSSSQDFGKLTINKIGE
jgi:hypothetical protein